MNKEKDGMVSFKIKKSVLDKAKKLAGKNRQTVCGFIEIAILEKIKPKK